MFRMCVHIKWFWKFCNTLDINFLCQILILWKSSGKAKRNFCMLLEQKKGGTTFQFILILLNTAEDLLCMYRTVSKALYCCSVYCIFITFKKYTTVSRASWGHSFLKRKGSILRDEIYPQATHTVSPFMLAGGGRQWPLTLSSHLLEHRTLTWRPVYVGAFKWNGWTAW